MLQKYIWLKNVEKLKKLNNNVYLCEYCIIYVYIYIVEYFIKNTIYIFDVYCKYKNLIYFYLLFFYSTNMKVLIQFIS